MLFSKSGKYAILFSYFTLGTLMNIAALVSGGVDSSVALKLLKEQHHTVTAFYLKIWLEDELSFLGSCPWEEDLSFVQQVCKQAQVPLEIISFQKEYWDEVVTYVIDQVKQGYTPNPDILCNQRIKFGAFYKAIGTTYDKIATGHYAQTALIQGKTALLQAPDPIKDQTYFLSHLSQEQLSRALFPIGSMNKGMVRALAQQYDLANKDRKDSQGICFLGKLKFDEFLRYHLGEKKGMLVEYESGKVVGSHRGFWFYTIGQRQGLGLPGGPWYVIHKNIQENIVYISRSYYAPDKIRKSFRMHPGNWISGSQPTGNTFLIKLRHGPSLHQAQVVFEDNGQAVIQLASNDQGIAPGQFAVFYDNQVCLGGGIIMNHDTGTTK